MAKWQGNRTIDYSKTVDVYLDIRSNLWSIRQGGKVCAKAKHVIIKDVITKFQPKKLERVLNGGKKEVCAWFRGTLVQFSDEEKRESGRVVTFNPTKKGYFYYKDSGERFKEGTSKVTLTIVDGVQVCYAV